MTRGLVAAAFVLGAIACSYSPSPSDVYAECDTDTRSTICDKGLDVVVCYQHAAPQTNGACTLILENAHVATPYTHAYVEDDYCCTDLDAGETP